LPEAPEAPEPEIPEQVEKDIEQNLFEIEDKNRKGKNKKSNKKMSKPAGIKEVIKEPLLDYNLYFPENFEAEVAEGEHIDEEIIDIDISVTENENGRGKNKKPNKSISKINDLKKQEIEGPLLDNLYSPHTKSVSVIDDKKSSDENNGCNKEIVKDVSHEEDHKTIIETKVALTHDRTQVEPLDKEYKNADNKNKKYNKKLRKTEMLKQELKEKENKPKEILEKPIEKINEIPSTEKLGIEITEEKKNENLVSVPLQTETKVNIRVGENKNGGKNKKSKKEITSKKSEPIVEFTDLVESFETEKTNIKTTDTQKQRVIPVSQHDLMQSEKAVIFKKIEESVEDPKSGISDERKNL